MVSTAITASPGSEGFSIFGVKLSENVSVTNRSTLDDVSPGTMNNPEGEKGTVLENPQIVRGPYLQQGTESGIYYPLGYHISCTRQVWYGTEPHRLSLTLEETTITCDHKVELGGLTPDTKYYYSVGTKRGVQSAAPKITFRNCAFN